jgi:predicted MFS family arabinose efflux permease
MLVTQTAMLVLAFVLAALTFPRWVQPWHILVLAFLLGIANAFDAPARQAFVSELVDRQDLTNAIALNGTMFNAAVALGPALGGVTYALLGPGWCFTLNGLSFVAVIVALALMRLGPSAPAPAQHSASAELREGIRYVLRDPAVRWLVALVGVTGLFAASFGTLVPAWAVNILHGDATTNGLLQSGRGVGALASALTVASLGRFNYKGRLLTVGTFVSPLLLLAFVWVRWLPLSLLVLAGVGAGFILIMNLANALVQTLVPDALRGRVMGVYSVVFFGTMPVGGLVMGALAQRLGEPAALIVGTSLALGFAALAYLRAPQLRALE